MLSEDTEVKYVNFKPVRPRDVNRLYEDKDKSPKLGCYDIYLVDTNHNELHRAKFDSDGKASITDNNPLDYLSDSDLEYLLD